MGQVLHGSATSTHAVRAAIQRSKASIAELSARYGLNPKTVAKWRKRDFVANAPVLLRRLSAPSGKRMLKEQTEEEEECL